MEAPMVAKKATRHYVSSSPAGKFHEVDVEPRARHHTAMTITLGASLPE
jgi:hypothetical protein